NRTLPEEPALSSHPDGAAFVRRSRAMGRDPRGAREQFEKRECAFSRRPAFGHHGDIWLRKINLDAFGPAAGRKRSFEKQTGSAARVRFHNRWRRRFRNRLRSGPVTDWQNLALDAGDLHQGLRRDSKTLRATAGLAGARLFSEPDLVQ